MNRGADLDTPLVWAEIDLGAIAHNIGELHRIAQPSARLMAVVKANAYGHGIIPVAEQALKSGADELGVARIDEGVRLRRAGLTAPVLIFGYTPVARARALADFDLIQTVSSYRTAKDLSETALSCGKKIRVHVKVDTGMGRLGLLPDRLRMADPKPGDNTDALREMLAIAKLKGVAVEGVFTHLAAADRADKSYAEKQFELFMDLVDGLQRLGLEIPVKHAANSAALLEMPHTHLDMVRAGIAIYGLYPSDEVDRRRARLTPAMSLKSMVTHLKTVPAGFKVGYGMTYETQKPTRLATVPVGYADGFNRLLSSRGFMLVRGCKAPVVGRVCMDMTVLDVGCIPGVQLEDEVVVFGSQGGAAITVDEIAESLNTISYEVVSTLSDRVPRVYCPKRGMGEKPSPSGEDFS